MTKEPETEASPKGQAPEALTWVGDYPITRNKTVAISVVAVVTISVGLFALFWIALMVHEGDFEFVGQSLPILGAIWMGVLVVFFLVGLLFFGGKVPMEVTIDDRGVIQAMRSKRARVANQVAIIGGALMGGARGATGAGGGLIAQSRQVQAVEFKGFWEAKGDPETGEIRLWDDWHTVMQIFAPPELYPDAIDRIRVGIAKAVAHRKARADIPGAAKALVTVGALLFGAFLLSGFPLGFTLPFVLPMVVLTVITIFARPSLRRILGWGLAGAVVLAVAVLFKLDPPALYQEGAGFVLGIQLAVLGLFVLFGVCAGLGVFEIKTRSLSS